MAGTYFSSSVKMKRKDLDDVYDDFSDFSLSSPARKIRRLDADLPPIMEEEDPVNVDQPPAAAAAAEVKEPMVDENLERAIVVYKQENNYPFLLHSPSDFTVSVDSDFISGIKNQYPWSSRSSNTKHNEEEETSTNPNMAVVPWVPSQLHLAQGTDLSTEDLTELMDAEQIGESAMEVEGDIAETLQPRHERGFDGMRANEGFPQWQQQHCLIPRLPFNTSTPISWS